MSSQTWNRAVASLLRLLGKRDRIQGIAEPRTAHRVTQEPDEVPAISSGRGEQASGKKQFVSSREDPSSLSSAAHLSVGEAGEKLASAFLSRSKCQLLESNLRVGGGEIDLIVLDGDEVVFVEVKSWVSRRDEDPAEAVDHRKQRLLTRAALVYLKQRGWLERAARFDIVAIRFVRFPEPQSLGKMLQQMKQSGNADGVSVKHYRSAFEAQGDSFFG